MRFCLTANYRQAKTLLRRIEASEHLWVACDELVTQHGLPERSIAALMDGARGFRIRRAGYIASVLVGDGREIAPLTATRDLRGLVEAGLLVASGERRARIYVGSDQLRGIWRGIRASRPRRPDEDPFDLPFGQMELSPDR